MTAQSAPDAGGDTRKAELDFWTSIKDSEKAADYQAYLDKYPDGDFADLAKLRIKKYAVSAAEAASPPSVPAAGSTEDPRLAEIDYWNAIKGTNNVQDYYAYLDKYPNGEFAELAKYRITQMTEAATPAPTLLVAPPAPAVEAAPPAEKPKDEAPAPSAPTVQPASMTAAPPAVEKPADAPPTSPEGPAKRKPQEEPASVTPAPDLAFKDADATLYAKGGGQVRAKPSWKTALLSKLKANTKVHATGVSSDGQWWRVKIAAGKTGYMHASVVSKKPVTAPDSKETAAPVVPDEDLCKADSELAANARVAACERALAKAGSDDQAKLAGLNDLAAALNRAGRDDEAIRKYEQAAELAPRDAMVYTRLGLVRLDQQKFQEARAAFEKAAQLDPENPDIVFQRGIAYVGLGDFEQARLEVKRALLTKDDPAYYEELGEIEIALGDFDAAKTALERGRKVGPKRRSLILLATNYLIGAMDQAEGQSAVADESPNAALWDAVLRKAKGDSEGAIQILQSARTALGKRAWPGPIFDALTGKTSAAKARAAARSKQASQQFQQLCALNYFIGEWAYLSGDKAAAREALQAAVDTRAYTLLEYAAAKARLAALAD
jgi:Flp pilus assembly protein TadD